MPRPLHLPQVLLTLVSVVYLSVVTPSAAQVQMNVLAFESETLNQEIGARGGPPSSGLSTEEWRAITRYIEGDQHGLEWTAESGPGEIVNEDAKLLASDGAWADYFGRSVAISGDTVVVGAFGDDDQALTSGSAYVFEKPSGGWSGTLSEAAKLLASDGASGDLLGSSVAVSGSTVVVGADYADDQGWRSGSAYVFERPVGGWSGTLSESAKLLPSDGASGDYFGYSVAVSGDTVVVGMDSGSAYVFEEPLGGWSATLNEDAKLLASDGSGAEFFGRSVAVLGKTVVVGAMGDNDQGTHSGSAYVFEKQAKRWSGTLNEDAKLLPSDGASWDYFGYSVAVSGDTVVVGASSDDDQTGSAYVFEKPSSGWSGRLSESAKLLASDGTSGDYFGRSLAFSGDTVVVGVNVDDDQGDYSGSAYAFEKPSGGWSGTLIQTAKLLASDGTSGDYFGKSVAVSGDTVVVGAFRDDDQGDYSGSAYVFVGGDSDGDGVLDELDVCTDTVIPESVPTRRLGRNRWALVDGDGVFDTYGPPSGRPGRSFTIEETGGCSCEQIIDALGLGQGHVKFGCSIGAMRAWVDLVNP